MVYKIIKFACVLLVAAVTSAAAYPRPHELFVLVVRRAFRLQHNAKAQKVMLYISGRPDTAENRAAVDQSWTEARLVANTNALIDLVWTTRKQIRYRDTPAKVASWKELFANNPNIGFFQTNDVEQLVIDLGAEFLPSPAVPE